MVEEDETTAEVHIFWMNIFSFLKWWTTSRKHHRRGIYALPLWVINLQFDEMR